MRGSIAFSSTWNTSARPNGSPGAALFLSDHCLEDVPRIRKVLCRAKLMVRVDPLHAGSEHQISAVIDAGADFVMLPYFHRRDEA